MTKMEERLLQDIKAATAWNGTVYPMRLVDKQIASRLVAKEMIVEAFGSWGTTCCRGYRMSAKPV